ncbi:unnamed protein product [Owenia fusiformis]|uniref:2'-phosphotransferase n=1 Tax=Owenia fusiformis TaxID=6347 RepID=A0A8J1U4T1_OWEFU|nr:unnamed protein product [Owenia fusiformis]
MASHQQRHPDKKGKKGEKKKAMSQVNVDKKLPKVLNYLLYKGGATEKSITVYEDGGVPISDILALPQYGDLYTEEDIIRVVKQDEDHSFKVDHNPSTKRLVVRPTEVVVQEPKSESQMPVVNSSNSIAANSHHNNITTTHQQQQQKQQQQQQQQQFHSAVQTNNLQKNNSLFIPISPGVQQLLKEEARKEEKTMERPKKVPISIKPNKGEPDKKVQKLVKTLDFLLCRGGAESKGLSLDDDGTLPVGDFQAHEQFSCYKMGDIHNAVACSNNGLILEKISQTGQIFLRAVNNSLQPARENDAEESENGLLPSPSPLTSPRSDISDDTESEHSDHHTSRRKKKNKAYEARSESDQSDDYGNNYKHQQQSELVPDTPLSDQSSTDNQPTPQKKKKKEKVDPDVKLPKILNFLFYKDGISEKNFKLNQDGFVSANDILECYSDFTLQDLKRVISADSGENYITLTDSFTQTLLLKAARDPPPKPSDNDMGYWEDPSSPTSSNGAKGFPGGIPDKMDHWDGKDKAGSVNGNSQSSDADFGQWESGEGGSSYKGYGRQRSREAYKDNRYRDPRKDTSWRKLLSTLHWVLTKGGAEKLGITVYEDGSAYVHEILALCRDLQGFTIEDVKYAIANDERQSFDWDLYSGDKKPIVWAKAQKKRDDVSISKSLSWLLRHGAEKMGFQLSEGGFLYIDDILTTEKFLGVSEEDIVRVVESNDKQRFAIQKHPKNGKLQIRANQGHTLEVEGLDLKPIENPSTYPTVVHGTYLKSWDKIKTQGLSRMSRQHIHLAPGEPSDSGVISGMRGSCDLLIFIDLHKAMSDGLKFHLSANNVILSSGDKQGYLRPKYFKDVLNRKTRQRIPWK